MTYYSQFMNAVSDFFRLYENN